MCVCVRVVRRLSEFACDWSRSLAWAARARVVYSDKQRFHEAPRTAGTLVVRSSAHRELSLTRYMLTFSPNYTIQFEWIIYDKLISICDNHCLRCDWLWCSHLCNHCQCLHTSVLSLDQILIDVAFALEFQIVRVYNSCTRCTPNNVRVVSVLQCTVHVMYSLHLDCFQYFKLSINIIDLLTSRTFSQDIERSTMFQFSRQDRFATRKPQMHRTY